MKCSACGADYLEGDSFCGTCGERLPQSGSVSAAAVATAKPPAPPPPPASSGPACPVCGATLRAEAARCDVCGFEPGSSIVMAGSQTAPPRAALPADTSTRVCPIHGPLDPSWTRCPYCLREGREGRLPSGPIGAMNAAGRGPEGPAAATPLQPAPAQPAPAQPAPPPPPPAFPAAPQAEAPSPVSFAPRVEPQEAIVPAAPPPAAQPSDSRATPLPPGEQPRSSVGATFAIRRRPRVLAYLIEREGEAVGRVHQLEDDVTDLGRDPRNHIVLTDVLISGFHARVERGPDGGFLVHDRKSTNGTFVNEEQLTEMRRLDENDALRLGNTTLVLKLVS